MKIKQAVRMSGRSRGVGGGRGMTLVEVMAAVAIVVVLLGVAVVATRKVIDSAKKSSAQTAMRLMASAIEEYSRFWPAPKGRAAAGFPEWDFGRLWGITENADQRDSGKTMQEQVADQARRDDPAFFANGDHWDRPSESNECLAYGLLAEVGGGPYLRNPPSGLVVVVLNASGGSQMLDRLSSVRGAGTIPSNATGQPVRRLVDPWGTPYLYQWLDGQDRPIPLNPDDPNDYGVYAARYRLISAGPDGMFGNEGKVDTDGDGVGDTAVDVELKSLAGDNLYHGPEPKATDTWSLFPR